MVKSIIYTAVALLFCLMLFFFSEWYINSQFSEFSTALDALYTKVEGQSASREDATAVRTLWDKKKSNLQIFLPHNDISYVDYWLSEACGLLYNEHYDLALGKIEVLREIAKNLPDAYGLRLDNIF